MTTPTPNSAHLPISSTVGVIGAGTMGQGIAALALRAGHPVSLHDTRSEALDSAAQAINVSLGRWVKRGEMSADQQSICMARLALVEILEGLADCSLVIEAIIEDLAIKKNLFSALENIVSEDALLTSNTSSISITAIAACLRRPQRFLGMHFFNPATVLPLVEVISGEATSPEAADTVTETARAWGKHPVHCRSTPGFIVNRVARPFYGEALLALQEQACDAVTVDAALRDAGGFKMGPLELMDLIGHDTNFAVTCTVFDSFFQDPRYKPSLIQQALVDAGWLGRKTGRGFFHYGEGASVATPDYAAPKPAPATTILQGEIPGIESLLAPAGHHAVSVRREPGIGQLYLDGTLVQPSTGITATTLSAHCGVSDIVLLDASVNYAKATLIVLSKSDQCSEQGLANAIGFFQALGKNVVVIDDLPGMLVTRTLCMLANEAAEAVCHGIASAADVDNAMLKGVNYPTGPLAWADSYGNGQIVTVLDNLAKAYPDGRYRASALLRRKAITHTRWTRTEQQSGATL